jgi:pimeloyl-ACP methyl ester carboxylesterase
VPSVQIGTNRLHYERRGSGEPLLLIQGLSGTHLHWGEPFLERLDGDFETIAYDHRGIGHSSSVSEPFSIVDLAEDAAGLLDALELESVHVFGISMGGMVAQELVLRNPERVRTLGLGATAAGGEGSTPTDRTIIHRLGHLIMSGQASLAMQEALKYNVSAEFASDVTNLAPFKQIARELPMSLEMLVVQFDAVSEHDASARLGEIEQPTLIVHGTEDQLLPVANARHMAGLMPHARLELLEGVGHMFWWERPERSATLVQELVSGARARQ